MNVENSIKMYSELLQRVILVVEGVAQASNCDSVALLLDHPRLVGVPNPLAPQASEAGNLSNHLLATELVTCRSLNNHLVALLLLTMVF